MLMRRHNRRLFRVVRAIVKDDAEAEDACQEAWLRAYRHLADLHHRAAFSSWIDRIGMRYALERRQRARGIVSLEELEERPAAGEVGLEGHFDGCQLARRIEHELDQLLPSYRAVVLLRGVEDMTTIETAEILGLTAQNVRVRLHRARACLRQRLAHQPGRTAVVGELGDARI